MATLTQAQKTTLGKVLESDPAAWLERNFWIEDPRDPETGEIFQPGPIRLAEHQKKILRYAFTRVNGLFPFVTVIYSTIKKSGKTRIAAGVASWFAATQGNYNEVYCIANDGKQSSDRILSAVKKSVTLNPNIDWHVTKTKVELPNGTFIEAIPCDPSGQAGSNPGLTVWSEMWGYRQRHQERLWSEMTIPPTRWGHAIRMVESYAGYSGESHVLENLYHLGTEDGVSHPAFARNGAGSKPAHLIKPGEMEIPVFVNPTARLFCYWDEGEAARRMPWQTEAYYAEEANTLRPSEFRRIHMNYWIDPVEKAIPVEWWDQCNVSMRYGDDVAMPPLDDRTPVVAGVDAAVSKDCCALVLLSRNPFLDKRDPEYNKQVAVRLVRVWRPPHSGGKIDLTETLEKAIKEVCRKYNVIMVCYDKYQLEKMARDLQKEVATKFYEFSQGSLRSVADQQLHTMIIHRRVLHDGNQVLRSHVDNAAAKTSGEKLRFVKPDSSEQFGRTKRPIDALVATSMGAYKCLRLIL